ncbi:hypothetical protein TD95_004820 [Thielaviopsis punctulata]|uniref:Rab-GAP TBC domain-containing protein n=1 Tax=Thielaviopsis punctulata TaxID=72032 RepID=A0A0F4ZDP4_9PEZI|nr:hypothetical protein TD95_004820 [Thielaviopsis punctulata]
MSGPSPTASTPTTALERSVSTHSAASSRSHRSVRPQRKRPTIGAQQPASTIASATSDASDKSLTSFPSFSGESPRLEGDVFSFGSINGEMACGNMSSSVGGDVKGKASALSLLATAPARPSMLRTRSAMGNIQSEKGNTHSTKARSASRDRYGTHTGIMPAVSPIEPVTTTTATPSVSLVENLTRSPILAAAAATDSRGLFEDDPIVVQKIPGALHLADDAHIQRLIARHGAVGLVRQIAEDLATRDAQMSAARRRAGERERALRRICRESGLSSLELEQRLKAVEAEMREPDTGKRRPTSMLSDMMSDAMDSDVLEDKKDATIRASGLSPTGATQGKQHQLPGSKGTAARGWKDYIWGGTAKQTSDSSMATVRQGDVSRSSNDKRLPLQNDLFNPPDKGSSAPPASVSASVQSPSRSSSVSVNTMQSDVSRKTSLASLALRLVVGGSASSRDSDPPRGRTRSTASNLAVQANTAKDRPSPAARALSMQLATKGSVSSLNSTKSAAAAVSVRRLGAGSIPVPGRSTLPERWDTMKNSPPGNSTQPLSSDENYGPVEMDTILPPDAQPPTLTHIYNRYAIRENLLTDRYGFIYDQRRKKRQHEAALMAQTMNKNKKNIGKEMLTNNNSRAGAPMHVEEDFRSDDEQRPTSPSQDSVGDDSKSRWQDYLAVATFPTELLAHTPSINIPTLEVTEGVEPALKSPTPSTAPSSASGSGPQSKIRGFVPTATTTMAASLSADCESTPTVASPSLNSPVTSPAESPDPEQPKDDPEPVKLLLRQLSDMHDKLQRERTVRWNDFLRKVRAERKREGEAAAAAAVAAAEARFETPAVILPEAKLADGEMVGVAGLGNKGKVGRAKWNEFKTLVLGGIPVAYRAKIWAECSGATGLRIPGYYDDIVAQGANGLDETVVSQIDMDIRRTLTDNIFFRKGPGVEKLNEVLLAYAHRNPEVGYCQGMNLIAANLLLITPAAEDAFWILASIIEHILPQGYYDHWLLASRADQHVLREYVGSVLPRLSAHLDTLGIELEALTFQWFLSVFTDCLSAEALFRVWDVVFCTHDGSTFLFQVALALLKLNEAALLNCDGPAGVYTYINHQMTNHAISIDGLVQASDGLKRVVKREDVMEKRDRAQQHERELLRQRELRLAALASPATSTKS